MLLPEILQLLPDAKVIHIVRDSRAVVASLLAASQGWGSEWGQRVGAAIGARGIDPVVSIHASRAGGGKADETRALSAGEV